MSTWLIVSLLLAWGFVVWWTVFWSVNGVLRLWRFVSNVIGFWLTIYYRHCLENTSYRAIFITFTNHVFLYYIHLSQPYTQKKKILFYACSCSMLWNKTISWTISLAELGKFDDYWSKVHLKLRFHRTFWNMCYLYQKTRVHMCLDVFLMRKFFLIGYVLVKNCTNVPIISWGYSIWIYRCLLHSNINQQLACRL